MNAQILARISCISNMTESNVFTLQYGSLHKPTQLIYKYLETIDIVGNMFHVKHLSQFDRKISIQVCKQSQLSRHSW